MSDFRVNAEEITSLAVDLEEHKWTYLRAMSLVEQGLLEDLEKTVSGLEDFVPGSFELKKADGADVPILKASVYGERGYRNGAAGRMESAVENFLCIAHYSKHLLQHTRFVEKLIFAREDIIVFQTPNDGPRNSVSIFNVKKAEITGAVEMKASELRYLVRTMATSNEEHSRKILRRAINKRNSKLKKEEEGKAPESPRLI